MLASPLLADDKAVPMTHVVGALDRLQRYDGLGERVVAGIIAEQEFVRRLNAAKTPEEEKEVVELGFARLATNLSEHIDRLEKQVQSERAASESRVQQLSATLEETSQAIERQDVQIRALVGRARTLSEEKGAIEGAANVDRSVLQSLQGTNLKLKKVLMASAVLVVALACYIVWPMLPTARSRLAAAVVGLAGVVTVGGWLWDKKTLSTASFWLALLALIATLGISSLSD